MIKKLTSLIIAMAMAGATLTAFAENADTTMVSETTAEEQVTVTENVTEETEIPVDTEENADTAVVSETTAEEQVTVTEEATPETADEITDETAVETAENTDELPNESAGEIIVPTAEPTDEIVAEPGLAEEADGTVELFAASTQYGYLYYSTNSAGTAVTITDCNTYATGAIEIPAEINSLPVTSIGGSAFYKCTGLTSVTIPEKIFPYQIQFPHRVQTGA